MLSWQMDQYGEVYSVLEGLAVRELVYYDPDDEQLPIDPDEVQCTLETWRKLV